MTTTQFIKKYSRIFSVYQLELMARVPRNTVAHSIGKEARPMKLAYEDSLQKFLEQMESDLSNALVEYWQHHKKDVTVKELPLKNGNSKNRPRKPNRKA